MHNEVGVQFKTDGKRFHVAFYLGIISEAFTLFASMACIPAVAAECVQEDQYPSYRLLRRI